jgi:serine/threonine protein kinase
MSSVITAEEILNRLPNPKINNVWKTSSSIHKVKNKYTGVEYNVGFNKYPFGKKLGMGAYGIVYTPSNDTSVVVKENFNKHTLTASIKEAIYLLNLDHPNIVKLLEILISDANDIHLVMPRYKGDLVHLLTTIENNPSTYTEYRVTPKVYFGNNIFLQTGFNKKFIETFLFQTLNAFSYLHTQGILHSDVKPNNILYTFENGNFTFYLNDFGLSDMYNTSPPISEYRTTYVWGAAKPPPKMNMPYNTRFQNKNTVNLDVYSLANVAFEMMFPISTYIDFNSFLRYAPANNAYHQIRKNPEITQMIRQRLGDEGLILLLKMWGLGLKDMNSDVVDPYDHIVAANVALQSSFFSTNKLPDLTTLSINSGGGGSQNIPVSTAGPNTTATGPNTTATTGPAGPNTTATTGPAINTLTTSNNNNSNNNSTSNNTNKFRSISRPVSRKSGSGGGGGPPNFFTSRKTSLSGGFNWNDRIFHDAITFDLKLDELSYLETLLQNYLWTTIWFPINPDFNYNALILPLIQFLKIIEDDSLNTFGTKYQDFYPDKFNKVDSPTKTICILYGIQIFRLILNHKTIDHDYKSFISFYPTLQLSGFLSFIFFISFYIAGIICNKIIDLEVYLPYVQKYFGGAGGFINETFFEKNVMMCLQLISFKPLLYPYYLFIDNRLLQLKYESSLGNTVDVNSIKMDFEALLLLVYFNNNVHTYLYEQNYLYVNLSELLFKFALEINGIPNQNEKETESSLWKYLKYNYRVKSGQGNEKSVLEIMLRCNLN